MKAIGLKQGLLAAAVIGALAAAPAFADGNSAGYSKSGDTAKMQDNDSLSHSARSGDRDDRSSSVSSQSTQSTQSTLQPCSSYKNPNAGKLADKDTGQAKEHSASPVHQDCIDDTTSAGTSTSGSISGSTSSTMPSTSSSTGATSSTTQGSSLGQTSSTTSNTTSKMK
jgi:hypothetical protein